MRRLDVALRSTSGSEPGRVPFSPPALLALTPGLFQGGVKPPHSKALRAFSCVVRLPVRAALRFGWRLRFPVGFQDILQGHYPFQLGQVGAMHHG